ncbi:MAG: GerMN domain-containing protein [Armatimonadota bacterium]|nr:GerMN domain-containing protein [bacterium]
MAKRKKTTFGIGWIFILVLFAFGAALGVTYYVSGSAKPKIKQPETKPVPIKPAATAPNIPTHKIVVYLPVSENDRLYLTSETRTTSLKGDILSVAVKVLIATNNEGGEAGKLIPQGTKLLNPVKVTDGIATVDLSEDFERNFSGGSTQEALVLNSLAHTLVDNSGGKVQKVQILVEGNKLETLGGHFELTNPFEADSTMLKN